MVHLLHDIIIVWLF